MRLSTRGCAVYREEQNEIGPDFLIVFSLTSADRVMIITGGLDAVASDIRYVTTDKKSKKLSALKS